MSASLMNIFNGFSAVIQGIYIYYSRPSLWRYGLGTMAILSLIYALVVYLFFGWLLGWLLGYLPDPNDYHVLISWAIWVLRILAAIGATLGVLLLLVTVVGSLFEICGIWFFDALVGRFETERYQQVPAPLTWRENGRFILESIRYALGTLLWSIVLLPVSFVPVVGIVIMAYILGRRMAFGLLFTPANHDRQGRHELYRLDRSQPGVITGMGVGAYLLLLIPFAVIVVLPPLSIAAAIVYHEKLRPASSPLNMVNICLEKIMRGK